MKKNQTKKQLRLKFWIFYILLTFFLGILFEFLDLNNSVKIWLLILYILLALLVFYLINNHWYRNLMKQVLDLSPILTEEKDPDRYIKEISSLLKDSKSAQLQVTYKMGLSSAYYQKQDYQKALDTLLSVENKRIFGVQKVAYLASLSYFYFYLDKNDQALTIMKKNRKGLDNLKNLPSLKPLILVNNIFEQIALNQPEKAIEILEANKEIFKDKNLEPDYLEIVKRLNIDE